MIRRWAPIMISLGIFAAICLLVAGSFGFIHPAFDTAAHFRLHVSALLVLGVIVFYPVFGGTVRTLSGLMAGIIGLYCSITATAFFAETMPAQPDKPVYRMLHLNLLYNHHDPAPVVDTILDLDADILSLSETFGVWTKPLEKLAANWPHIGHCKTTEKNSSIRIYSKFPLDGSDDYCGPHGTFLKTAVRFPSGADINLGSVHTRWPWPASGPKQYAAFEPVMRGLGPDALIAGDFNATPWSHAVSNFASAGGLEIVPGIGLTWLFLELPGWMIKWIGLPIDHVMAKGQVQILSAKSLQPVGSDHLPVMIEFQVD